MSFSEWKDSELGKIPVEWEVVKIEDIADVVSGGTPSTKNEEYYGDEIAWITPKDLSGYTSKYIFKGERSITQLGLKNSSAKLLPSNTVLFSSRAPIGYVAISQDKLTTNQGFKNLVCDHTKSDFEFMYYKMKTLKEPLELVAGGSTFKEVSGKVVKEFKIILPPLQEQKAIANILSSLDEKIELNNQMNKTLEEMAQALFKRWFVDFEFPNEDGEPYKSSGGEMIDSELGMIPKGWEVTNIKSLAEVTDYVANGSFASLKENVTYCDEQGYAILIRLVDYNKDFQPPFTFVDERGYKFLKKSSLNGGEIIISNVGANAGTVFKAPKMDTPMTLGPNSIMLMKNEYDNYLYALLSSYMGQEKLKAITTGSAQPKFNKTDFRNIKVIRPNANILKNYNVVIEPIEEKIEQNNKEKQNLYNIRDTLLPKLMSGEIRVTDLQN